MKRTLRNPAENDALWQRGRSLHIKARYTVTAANFVYGREVVQQVGHQGLVAPDNLAVVQERSLHLGDTGRATTAQIQRQRGPR